MRTTRSAMHPPYECQCPQSYKKHAARVGTNPTCCMFYFSLFSIVLQRNAFFFANLAHKGGGFVKGCFVWQML